MRQIKISYRAQFRQPIGSLNPLGARLSAVVSIEVFQTTGKRWSVRNYETRAELKQLTEYGGAENAKTGVQEHFAEQLSEWKIWGKPPNEPVARELQSDEVKELPAIFGNVYAFLTAEDYTHILHAPNVRPNLRVPNAACGATVPTRAFINNRAQIEPTCRKCAEIWFKHYRQQQAGEPLELA